MELIDVLKNYAATVGASSFDAQYNYHRLDTGGYCLKDIDIYFRDTEEKELESYSFDTPEKAIEGMKGLIQFKQNLRA